MNGYLLDTHVWLWAQQGGLEQISRDVRVELERSQLRREVFVSAISILEIARLVALNHISLGSSVEAFVAEGTKEAGLHLLDLTPSILIGSTRLPGNLPRDPNDRLLIATARQHELTLITRDKDILRYAKQGHLRVRKP